MTDLSALVPDVLAHAVREQPLECCGLAVLDRGGGSDPTYWPARNIATNPGEFVIHPEDQAAAEDAGEVIGICHSHVYRSALPSAADRVGCRRSGLPWLIVAWPTATWQVLLPDPEPEPLLGRQFVHGVLDCYSLVRDYYAGLGILLPDYPRYDEWWLKGGDLYRQQFAGAGFAVVPIEDLRPHDALLMQVAAPVPNHAGVIDAGGYLLHHCHGRLSSRDVYGGYWRRVTRLVLRHEDLA